MRMGLVLAALVAVAGPAAAQRPDRDAIRAAAERCEMPERFLEFDRDAEGERATIVPPADLDELPWPVMNCLLRWAQETGARITFVSEPPPEEATAREFGGRPLQHTPWLALRFGQAGTEAPLFARGLYISEARLRRAPFTLVLPRRGRRDLYRITAWTNDSIFATAPLGADGESVEGPRGFNYFAEGTGIADTPAGSGLLYLNNEGHNYLNGLRLGPNRTRHEVQYSGVFRDRAEIPLAAVEGPLYLTAFFDENRNGVMENGEYEFLVLHFAD